MRDNASNTYAPINTPKRVPEGMWIVDGPLIRFGWHGRSFASRRE